MLGSTAVAVALAVVGCGGSSPKPGPTLNAFTSAWSNGDWSAMRAQVAHPPKDFVSTNAAAFKALGVTQVTIDSGRVITAKSGDTAKARIATRYQLPELGDWSVSSTVHLVQRNDKWRVKWTPATIVPQLKSGETIAVSRTWPTRAQILGAGGAKLTSAGQQITIGLDGARVQDWAAVRTDLLAAGAPHAAVQQAITAAKANPDLFEPVFTVSHARYEQLKATPGSENVYVVLGTEFVPSNKTEAITQQLTDHLVGTVGPITAEQLKQLGPPYDASSLVGQSGLQASQERTLAGTPTTAIEIERGSGDAVARLATFPGKPGQAVQTSIDPKVQRAAESALASATHKNVSMVAIRASTGQVLAVVSDPLDSYDTALQGAYPPGSTFKVLTSSALFGRGLTPSSPASCPPTRTVDGETFHNAEGDSPVSNITEAFTESCNTAFIGLATDNLAAADFPAVAKLYGLQRTPQIGVPAFMDNIPKPNGQTELAADSIGQGNVTFSALGMATVAAAIDSGVVRAPRLVTGAADDSVPTSKLPSKIVDDLRPMMADVVASGTAAGQGLPSGTYAKTGTAEYGTGPESSLKIDGWLMGYRGDIAFAIITHNTGGADGGPVNGPIIAKFLDALGSQS